MAAKKQPTDASTGIAFNKSGDAAYDPSSNVLALVESTNKRQDDLRAKDREISDLQHMYEAQIAIMRDANQTNVATLREGYQEKIQHAESGRLDSIRQVDREEVAKTAVAANNAITLLASQTTELASTLDKKVSDTAAAAEARNSAQYSDTNKRLSALELSSSEGKGKQTVADPQMEKLTTLVELLAKNQATGSGKSEGISATWAIIIAVGAVVVSLFGPKLIGSGQPSATPAPIVLQLPSGALVPTVPPAATPR